MSHTSSLTEPYHHKLRNIGLGAGAGVNPSSETEVCVDHKILITDFVLNETFYDFYIEEFLIRYPKKSSSTI